MGKFKINKTISQADSIFNSTLEYIEKKLKENIVSVKKMDKLYGSKSNNNTVITAGNFGGLNRYVLKFSTQDDIEGEVRGTKFIEDYLPVPKTILSSKNKDNSWLLREYVPGVLMTDVTNHFEVTDKNGRLEEMEREKERLVVRKEDWANKTKGNTPSRCPRFTPGIFLLFGNKIRLIYSRCQAKTLSRCTTQVYNTTETSRVKISMAVKANNPPKSTVSA